MCDTITPPILVLSVNGKVERVPSLFRFLLVIVTLVATGFGGLYALATYVDPEPHEVSKPVPGVKVRRP